LLLILSVLSWIASQERGSGDVRQVLSYVSLVVDCAMMWNLLGGVMVYAEAHARPDLAASASFRRGLYVVFMAVVMIVGHTQPGAGNSDLAILLILIMLVLVFMILHLIRCVRREIALAAPRDE